MQLSDAQYDSFMMATADFSSDHTEALATVRRLAKVPENRYFSVLQDKTVIVDTSRIRVVESRKLSKSDQS